MISQCLFKKLPPGFIKANGKVISEDTKRH